jgi:hypothetical protein
MLEPPFSDHPIARSSDHPISDFLPTRAFPAYNCRQRGCYSANPRGAEGCSQIVREVRMQFLTQHLTGLLIAWACLTTVLVLLLIYRSTLTMHEDDQLFLDDSEAHMHNEQIENTRKMERLTPFVRIFSAASGLLILGIAVIWVYGGLSATQ